MKWSLPSPPMWRAIAQLQRLIWKYLCMYIWMYICNYVCMYVCMYWFFFCIYKCMYVYVYNVWVGGSHGHASASRVGVGPCHTTQSGSHVADEDPTGLSTPSRYSSSYGHYRTNTQTYVTLYVYIYIHTYIHTVHTYVDTYVSIYVYGKLQTYTW